MNQGLTARFQGRLRALPEQSERRMGPEDPVHVGGRGPGALGDAVAQRHHGDSHLPDRR